MAKRNNIHKKIHERFVWILLLLTVVSIIVVLKILYLQTIRKPKLMKYDYAVVTDKIYGLRGDILSRNKKILATTSVTYDIYYDPNTQYLQLHDTIFYHNIDSLSRGLAQILKDKTAQEYKNLLLNAKERGLHYVLLKKNISIEEYKKLKKLPIFNLGRYRGGLIAQQHSQRIKPYGYLASRTIGEYSYNTSRKTVGIELAYNEELSGIPGIAKYRAITGTKRIVSKVIIPPEDGADVVTTLDINLQDYIENTLEEQLKYLNADWGVAIVMDVKSGDILAMANLMRSHKDSTQYYEKFNNAIAYLYEVGSVMKPISMLALFEEHPEIDINYPVYVPATALKLDKNITIRDDFKHPLGHTTLRDVVAHSSNIGVIKIIQQFFSHSQYSFINRLVDIGLSKPTGFDIPGEHPAELKDPEQKRWWKLVSLGFLSIGYEYQMTPLEVLSIYNAIANNGQYVTPHIGKMIIKNGRVKHLDFGNSHYIASINSVRKVQKLLESVVEFGTASHTVKSKYVKIAGKTGTAKIFNRKVGRYVEQYNTTFVGYFPADHPKYSMIVVIHKPQKYGHRTGATASGPVFKKIAEYLYRTDPELHNKQDYIVNLFPEKKQIPPIKFGRPDYTIAALNFFGIYIEKRFGKNTIVVRGVPSGNAITLYKYKIYKNIVPDVRGMSATDATFVLENLGLNVKLSGRGRVYQQSIPSGTKIKKNETIYLTLR